MPAPAVLCFLDFVLDPANARLRQGDRIVPLRPKVFAVLTYLAERSGQLVTKDELLDAVWPGTAVGEGVLSSGVRDLRRILGDDPRAPHIIETAHRLGYRFIAAVTTSPAASTLSSSTPGPSSEPVAHGAAGEQARMTLIGRGAELAALDDWLARVQAGERQVGFILGEPGIGKTTLVEAFLARVQTSGSPTASPLIARGQCLQHYGDSESYMPLLEAFGRLCRTEAGPPLIELFRRHAPSWLTQLPGLLEPNEAEALQSHLRSSTRERMLREMASLVEELSQPLILVLEDLHWSDYATVDLIARLAYGHGGSPLLLIGTVRPVDVAMANHPLKSVREDLRARGACRDLWMRPLGVDGVVEYLRTRCAGLSSIETLAREIHTRTDGNPLFFVNVVDGLVAEGALVEADGQWALTVDAETVGVGVPDGLREMLTTQIERLSESDRDALQAASVRGVMFSAAVVAAAIEADVVDVETRFDRLARRHQLIRDAGERRFPDATVSGGYEFIHALYQDVLRDNLPPARLRRLHGRIAARLEAGYGDRAGEVAAELALHFAAGGEPDRAVPYLAQGGARAAKIGASHEAVKLLERGLELLGELEPTPERKLQTIRLCLALGQALQPLHGFSNPESLRAFSRARALSEEADDPVQLFQAVASLNGVHVAAASFAAANETAQRLDELMERLPLPAFVFGGHVFVGMVRYHSGDLHEARTRLEQALADGEVEQPPGPMDFYVHGLNCLANTLLHQGYPDQARQRIGEAEARAEAVGSPFDRALSALYACFLQMNARDTEGLAPAADRATSVGTEFGFPMPTAIGQFALGRLRVDRGDHEAGIAAMTEAVDLYEASGHRVALAALFVQLAEAQARAGRTEEALQYVARGLAFVESSGEIRYEPALRGLEGELHWMRGEGSAAQHSLRQAVDIAQRQGARWWELRASVSLARLLRQQRKRTAARGILEPITLSFAEGLDTPDVRTARELLAELS